MSFGARVGQTAAAGALPPPRAGRAPTAVLSTDVSTLPYYHPNLKNMDEIKQTLNRYSTQEGHFLLRNSLSKSGYFSISVMHSTGIKHFNVERSPTSFYLKDIHFQSMDQLVQYYSHNDVPNKEQVRNVRLIYPITRKPEKSTFQQVMRSAQTNFNSPVTTTTVVARNCDSYLPVVPDDGTTPVYIHPNSKPNQALRRIQTVPPSPRPHLTDANPLRRSLNCSSTPGNMYLQDNVDEAGYSIIPSQAESKVDAILEELKHAELSGESDCARCECGLPVDKAALPRGWSIHLSHDEETFEEVYFMSPSHEPSWTLPLVVSLELSADQQDFIRDCIYDYESKYKRSARARLGSSSSSSVAPVTSSVVTSLPVAKPTISGYISSDSYVRPTRVDSCVTRPSSSYVAMNRQKPATHL
jgi:hypothetical protein